MGLAAACSIAVGREPRRIFIYLKRRCHPAKASWRFFVRHARAAMSLAQLPLVYSCSGCSSAAQMANELALRLFRDGLAEMSCVAGIGGGVDVMLRRARASRPRLVLDGCPLACARACLDREDIRVDAALDLSRHGVRRRPGVPPDPLESERIWQTVVLPAVRALAAPNPLSFHPPLHGENNELEPRRESRQP